MATTTVAFSKVLIKKGDGASPEAYTAPCLINGSKAIQITASYSEDVIPDCDNPDDPAQILRQADSISVTINGSGKLHQDDAKTYVDLALGGVAANWSIEVGTASATGAFKIRAPFVVTDFSINTNRPTTAECDISLASSALTAASITALT
jgi:hypothetical protein